MTGVQTCALPIFLHQLEHGHDVPLFVSGAVQWNVLCQEQNNRREQPLSGIVEERILPAILIVTARIDDGFGKNLRIFFRFCPRRKVVRMFPCDVHVAVDERQQIAPVRARRVAQIDHGDVVAVVFFRDRAVIS